MHTHTYRCPHKSDFKKPDVRRHMPGLKNRLYGIQYAIKFNIISHNKGLLVEIDVKLYDLAKFYTSL